MLAARVRELGPQQLRAAREVRRRERVGSGVEFVRAALCAGEVAEPHPRPGEQLERGHPVEPRARRRTPQHALGRIARRLRVAAGEREPAEAQQAGGARPLEQRARLILASLPRSKLAEAREARRRHSRPGALHVLDRAEQLRLRRTPVAVRRECDRTRCDRRRAAAGRPSAR